MGVMTPREKSRAGSIHSHSLIRFILDREGVSESHLGIGVVSVEDVSLLEIFPGGFVFFDVVVVNTLDKIMQEYGF